MSEEIKIGEIHGRLKILSPADPVLRNSGYRRKAWNCECQCENKTKLIVLDNAIKTGNTRSCGCIQKEFASTLKKRINEYDLSGEYGICYSFDKSTNFIFDLEDYDKIKDYCWSFDKQKHYFVCSHHKLALHRFLLDCPKGFKVDHISGDKHDNRKSNLRIVNSMQNAQNKGILLSNTSGTPGVNFVKATGRWRARITVNRKEINLGTFLLIEDAIKARKAAEKKYFGEYARKEENLSNVVYKYKEQSNE